MKRRSVVCFLVLCVFFAAYLCAPVQAAEGVIQLSYASYVPPIHKMHKIHEDYGKEIEKRSNGKVKVVYYPAQTLLQAAWTYTEY